MADGAPTLLSGMSAPAAARDTTDTARSTGAKSAEWGIFFNGSKALEPDSIVAMDYQRDALVVQGGWLVVRGLGIWVVVAIVLLGRRMVDVRASGRRVAPGVVRLVGTWCAGIGTLGLLVVLAYWGVYQLGI